jgi:hypothetical protein
VIDNNYLETKLMKAITENIILTKKSKHFLIMYQSSSYKEISNDTSYMVNNNEYFTGNISSIITSTDIDINLNILIQSLLSVGSFHNLIGYIHMDCKYQNFLYQNNTYNTDILNGYYKYTLNSKNYYLKSTEYNIMIFNFCNSKIIPLKDINIENIKDIKDLIDLLFVDYMRIFTDIYIKCNKEKVVDDFFKRFKILEHHYANVYTDVTDFIDIHDIELDLDDGIKTSKPQNTHELSKQILIDIINLCIIFFPNILTDDYTKLKGATIINNDEPYELYLENKIVTKS